MIADNVGKKPFTRLLSSHVRACGSCQRKAHLKKRDNTSSLQAPNPRLLANMKYSHRGSQLRGGLKSREQIGHAYTDNVKVYTDNVINDVSSNSVHD